MIPKEQKNPIFVKTVQIIACNSCVTFQALSLGQSSVSRLALQFTAEHVLIEFMQNMNLVYYCLVYYITQTQGAEFM